MLQKKTAGRGYPKFQIRGGRGTCVVREKGVKIEKGEKTREKAGYPNRCDQSSSHAMIPGKGR